MTAPDVRPATLADLPGILALYRHLHPGDPEPDPALAQAAWSALLSSGLTVTFVAELEGVLASTCTLAIIPNLTRGARPYGVIENVVTHAGHRGEGLGRAVLRAAVERAWTAGCHKVVLTSGSGNEGTLAFYEAAGFRRGGKTYFEIRRA